MMSLYDDDELEGTVGTWSPGGMKLLQTHVQLKTRVNQLAGLVSTQSQLLRSNRFPSSRIEYCVIGEMTEHVLNSRLLRAKVNSASHPSWI